MCFYEVQSRFADAGAVTATLGRFLRLADDGEGYDDALTLIYNDPCLYPCPDRYLFLYDYHHPKG